MSNSTEPTREIWKISIHPGEDRRRPNVTALEWCLQRDVVGVGWAEAYSAGAPSGGGKEGYYELLRSKENWGGRVPSTVRTLLEQVRAGDIVCLYRRPNYVIAIVRDDEARFGPELGADFLDYDIGHARNVDWVEIEPDLAPGFLLRFATIQGILARSHFRSKYDEPTCNAITEGLLRLHAKKRADPAWRPHVDDSETAKVLRTLSKQAMFSAMTPDDCEDVILCFLQDRGWRLLKSTAWKSRPDYECDLLRVPVSPGGVATGRIQVKSGDERINTQQYQDLPPGEVLFLFSTASSDPYQGDPPPRVECLDQDDVVNWMRNNPSLLSRPLRMRLHAAA